MVTIAEMFDGFLKHILLVHLCGPLISPADVHAESPVNVALPQNE